MHSAIQFKHRLQRIHPQQLATIDFSFIKGYLEQQDPSQANVCIQHCHFFWQQWTYALNDVNKLKALEAKWFRQVTDNIRVHDQCSNYFAGLKWLTSNTKAALETMSRVLHIQDALQRNHAWYDIKISDKMPWTVEFLTSLFYLVSKILQRQLAQALAEQTNSVYNMQINSAKLNLITWLQSGTLPSKSDIAKLTSDCRSMLQVVPSWSTQLQHWCKTMFKYGDEPVCSIWQANIDVPVVAKAISGFKQIFQENGNLLPQYQTHPKDQRHHVVPMLTHTTDQPGAHIKFLPDAPGNEIAVSLLHHLLVGHGAPLATLARFPKDTFDKSNAYPVLLSETVEGTPLSEWFAEQRELNLEQHFFADMVLMAMLTMPFDGKPANYIVVQLECGQQRLVAIDNELSFPANTVVKIKHDNNISLELQLITCLFCFDNMNKPIPFHTRDQWLKLNPQKIMLEWCETLLDYNKSFAEGKRDWFKANDCTNIRDRYKTPENSGPSMPMLLPKELVKSLAQRLILLQELLTHQPHISLLDVLQALLPEVACFYRPLLNDSRSAEQRFIELGEQHHRIELKQPELTAADTDNTASSLIHMVSSGTVGQLEQSWLHCIPTKGLFEPRLDINALIQNTGVVERQRRLVKDAVNMIFKLRSELVKLRTLLLSDNTVKQQAAEMILKDMTTNSPNLIEHMLTGNGIQNPPVKLAMLKPKTQNYLFNTLSKIPMQRLYLQGCKQLTSTQLNILLTSSPFLQALDVSGCIELTSNDLLMVAKKCRFLKALNVSGLPKLIEVKIECKKTSNGKIWLPFPELKRLWLDSCTNLVKVYLEIEQLEKLSLRSCENLISANLFCNKQVKISPSTKKIIYQPSPIYATFTNKNLLTNKNSAGGFTFTWCGSGVDSELLFALENTEAIKNLELIGEDAEKTSTGVSQRKLLADVPLFTALSKNNGLRSLKLNNFDFDEKHTVHLVTNLMKNSNIQNIDLSDCHFDALSSHYILMSLENNNTLSILHIALNGNLAQLIEFIKKNKTLTELYIHSRIISLEYIYAICQSLEENLTLEVLDFVGNDDKTNLPHSFDLLQTIEKLLERNRRLKLEKNPIPNIIPSSSHSAGSYVLAAKQSQAQADYQLAIQYRDGLEIDAQPKKAIYYFKQSANQNHFEAQLALAKCFQLGIGVSADNVIAAYWAMRAEQTINKKCYLQQIPLTPEHALTTRECLLVGEYNIEGAPVYSRRAELDWSLIEKKQQNYYSYLLLRIAAINPQKIRSQLNYSYYAQKLLAESYKETLPKRAWFWFWQLMAKNQLSGFMGLTELTTDPLLKRKFLSKALALNTVTPKVRGKIQEKLQSLPRQAYKNIVDLQPTISNMRPAIWPEHTNDCQILQRDSNLYKLLEKTIRCTSDSQSFTATPLEPARIKTLLNNPNPLFALKQDWDNPPAYRGYINCIDIESITFIDNKKHWEIYTDKINKQFDPAFRSNLQDVVWTQAQHNGLPVLNARIGEVWLYHGSSYENIKSIIENNFEPEKYCRREPLGGYGPLGRGTYFTDNFAKAATYVNARSENSVEPRHILICRVVLGNIKIQKSKDRMANNNKGLSPQFQSIYAPSKLLVTDSKFRSNEFCLPVGSLIYPEYLIAFKPSPKRQPEPPVQLPLPSSINSIDLQQALQRYHDNCQYATPEQRRFELEAVCDYLLLATQTDKRNVVDYQKIWEMYNTEYQSLYKTNKSDESRLLSDYKENITVQQDKSTNQRVLKLPQSFFSPLSLTPKKVIFLGDGAIGKSVLIHRMVTGKYEQEKYTVGVNFAIKDIGGFRLQIWDTAGHERYRSIIRPNLKNSHAYVFIVDQTTKRSLNGINIWHHEILKSNNGSRKNIPLILVITKCDLEQHRIVTRNEIIEKALEFGFEMVIETSAKNNINIEAVGQGIVFLLRHYSEPDLLYLYSYQQPDVRLRCSRDVLKDACKSGDDCLPLFYQ